MPRSPRSSSASPSRRAERCGAPRRSAGGPAPGQRGPLIAAARRQALGLVLGLLSLLAAGPAAAGQLPGQGSTPMSTVTLTASDDGRAIDLRVGDSVVLRL